MTEVHGGNELDPIEQIARAARGAVTLGEGARERALAAVRAEPRPVRETGITSLAHWVRERHSWSFTPLRAAAVAAGLVGIGMVGGHFVLESRRGGLPTGQQIADASSMPTPSVSGSGQTKVFVLIAPEAKQVALVGDFNMWDKGATPMVKSQSGGVWKVTLPLAAGRHVYSFVVIDGANEQLRSDPAAPLAPDGNSVIVIPAPAP